MIDSIFSDLRNYRLVFIHNNAIVRKIHPNLFDSIKLYTIEEFLEISNEKIKELPSREIGLINLENYIIENSSDNGRIRAKIHELFHDSFIFLIISSISADSYPPSPASDFIIESKKKNVPINRDEWKSIENRDESFFEEVLRELPQSVVEDLYKSIWLSKKYGNDCLEDLNFLSLNSLAGASLIFNNSDRYEWIIGSDFKKLKNIICLEIQRNMGEFDRNAEVYTQFYFIENFFRLLIMKEMINKYSLEWRSKISKTGNILERAQSDTYPDAEKIEDIGNPLVYLDFSEILDLQESNSLGDLGIKKVILRRIRNDLIPMRNSVAHMRTLSEDDRRIVNQIYNVIKRQS